MGAAFAPFRPSSSRKRRRRYLPRLLFFTIPARASLGRDDETVSFEEVCRADEEATERRARPRQGVPSPAVLRIFLPGSLIEQLRRFFGAGAKHVRDPIYQALIAASLPKSSQGPQSNRQAMLILELRGQGQRLEMKVSRLYETLLGFGKQAELPIGPGLAVAVVELDLEGEGLLVKLLGLGPAPLVLRDPAQLGDKLRPARSGR